MASSEIPSNTSTESSPPSLEQLSAMGARALLLPFILNFASIYPPSQSQREVMVLVNSRIGSITFIEGSFDQLDMVMSKDGPLPASKSSIESLPIVKVVEETECVICMSELKVGEEAKELPCRHKYHLECVDKWLRINGSCPTCRYKLPVDEEKVKEVEGGESGEERSRRAPIVFNVIIGRDRNVYSDSDSNTDSNGQRDSEETSRDRNMYSDSDINSDSNRQLSEVVSTVVRDGEELTRVEDMEMSIDGRDGDESTAQNMDMFSD